MSGSVIPCGGGCGGQTFDDIPVCLDCQTQRCRRCTSHLAYADEPSEYLYCPQCLDWAYALDNGARLGRIT